MIIDDYKSWEGCKKAVDDYFKDKKVNDTVTVKVLSSDNKGLIVQPEGCDLNLIIKKSQIAMSASDARPSRFVGGERIDAAITFMKLSAKLIIEDEYDRKFLSLKAEDSKLEQYFWNAQVTEANNLEGETPILNSIATAKSVAVSDVAASVLAGNKAFNEKALALYDAMVALKQKFTDCATIKELNVLWENYLGVPMPEAQAIELGNTDDDGGALPIKYVLQF